MATQAEHGILKDNLNQETIANIHSDKNQALGKPKKSRQRFLAEGKVWLDKDDIRDFFRNWEETEQKKKQQLVEKAKDSVLTLSKNLKQKKLDVVQLESAGRLTK